MFRISFTADDLKRVAWTAGQAFIAVFVAGLNDAFNAFTHEGTTAGKAASVALVVAAGAAAISALKNAVLADGSAVK